MAMEKDLRGEVFREDSTRAESAQTGWKRAAGVLLPIFSLPGRYGIGGFGEEAFRFADFLSESGQSYWQILPLGPTGYGDSPYQSFSTFAGNPYFIDLPTLIREGLLTEEECEEAGLEEGAEEREGEKEDRSGELSEPERRISYERQYRFRYPLLRKAYARFQRGLCGEESWEAERESYQEFLQEEELWLPDYAAFMAKKSGDSEDFHCFLQYEFRKQWRRLKRYVNERGIELIGDIPIYVSQDSSDLLSDPKLFQLSPEGEPLRVAGCPPDSFAADGQLWGNPLYDWEYHRKSGYRWWIERMRHCFSLYDIVRVDHFRGFDEYFSIPSGDKDARGGRWEKGPGIELFRALKEALGEKRIIAEDLGYVTDSVRKLVRDTGFPGMKVLEFAFDSREEADYSPDGWPENSVGYTGTHDNQVLKAWFTEISEEDRQMAAEALHTALSELESSNYVDRFIELSMQTKANTVIIPLQDYLRFGAESRINKPSTLGGNWSFRFLKSDFTAELSGRIRKFTEESGRG